MDVREKLFVKYNLGAAEMPSGVDIIIVIATVLIAMALVAFLYLRVMKERNRYLAEKMKLNSMDKKGFDEYLARKIRSAKKDSGFFLMFIKVWDGKGLLNSLGKTQYAAMLKELQERFYAVLVKDTRICLYKEDTFAIISEGRFNDDEIKELAEFCIDEGNKPVTFSTQIKVSVDLTVGGTVFDYAKKLTFGEFLSEAEQALLFAEKKGTNGFCLFSSETEFEDDKTVALYRDVKSGIERGEFTLHYQPIKSVKGETVAYESFLRWRHPEYGVLKAEKFLPVLIKSGYLNRVGAETFAELCLAVNKFKREVSAETSVKFSMNFNYVQMLLPSFADGLRREVKKRHLSESDFVMEISEFVSDAITENVEKLKKHGFCLAIDGFDMKNADALKQLQNLSPDWVKLPMSFIRTSRSDVLSRGIIDVIVGYFDKGDVKIIATGVESKDDLELVKAVKIGFVQGNFIAEESESLALLTR